MDPENSKRDVMVYVVDDNALLGHITAQLVEAAGFRTRFFTDGYEGNEALCSGKPKPSILITDFDLGAIKGFELITTAKAHIPGIKCLMVSGSIPKQRLNDSPIKPDHFLPKPFKPDELISLVRQMARE